MVDGVILVAAAHRTSKRSIVHAVELLEQVGTPIVGSVLNGVRESRGGRLWLRVRLRVVATTRRESLTGERTLLQAG